MRRFLFACGSFVLSLWAHAEVIDVDSLALSKLTEAGVPVIDVRTPAEWAETGVIPGSHLLMFFDEKGQADVDAWLKKAKSIARPTEPVAIICRSGRRSKAVSQILSQQAGYGKVYNIRDGIVGWSQAQRPLVSSAPVLAACRTKGTC